MSSPMRSAVAAVVVPLLVALGGCADTDDKADDDATAATEPAAATDDPGEAATALEPVPSPGCVGGIGTIVRDERRTLQVGGVERWYLLTVPPSSVDGGPVPLVLDIHGLAEGAELHTRLSGYGDLAEEEGFIVAHPQGSGPVMPGWNTAIIGENNDVDTLNAIVDSLAAERCIDMSRVYATGYSNGALISSTLACAHSSRFAAIVPVAGVAFPPECAPDHAIPVMAIHGSADPILRFNGGEDGGVLGGALSGQAVTTTSAPPGDIDGAGFPAAAKAWSVANGCGAPTDTEAAPGIVHRVWDCPEGADTELYVVQDGGHTWPGSDALTNEGVTRIVGLTTMELDATRAGWEFMSAHTRSDPS